MEKKQKIGNGLMLGGAIGAELILFIIGAFFYCNIVYAMHQQCLPFAETVMAAVAGEWQMLCVCAFGLLAAAFLLIFFGYRIQRQVLSSGK